MVGAGLVDLGGLFLVVDGLERPRIGVGLVRVRRRGGEHELLLRLVVGGAGHCGGLGPERLAALRALHGGGGGGIVLRPGPLGRLPGDVAVQRRLIVSVQADGQRRVVRGEERRGVDALLLVAGPIVLQAAGERAGLGHGHGQRRARLQRPVHGQRLALRQVDVAARVVLHGGDAGHVERAARHVDAAALRRLVAGDGRARQDQGLVLHLHLVAVQHERAVAEIHAAAVALGRVPGDADVRGVEQAVLHIDAAAVDLGRVAGDAGRRHGHSAAADMDAAAAAGGVAAGDPAGLRRAGVGDGQRCAAGDPQHAAVLDGLLEAAVDGVAVQVQRDLRARAHDQDGLPCLGGHILGELHRAARVQRLLQPRPGAFRRFRRRQQHLTVPPGDHIAFVRAGEACGAVGVRRSDHLRGILGGRVLHGHADIGRAVQRALHRQGGVQFIEYVEIVARVVRHGHGASGQAQDAAGMVDAAALLVGRVAGDRAALQRDGLVLRHDIQAAAVLGRVVHDAAAVEGKRRPLHIDAAAVGRVIARNAAAVQGIAAPTLALERVLELVHAPAALCGIVGDAAAVLDKRAVIDIGVDIDAAALAVGSVALDAAAVHGKRAPGDVHAAAGDVGLVAGDVAGLQRQIAAIYPNAAAAFGIAAGDLAPLGCAGIGDGQLAAGDVEHAAVRSLLRQVAVHGVAVQVQGHVLRDGQPGILRPGGDVLGELHRAARVQFLLEGLPGGEALRQPRLAVRPFDDVILVVADKAGRAVRLRGGDDHGLALFGQLFGGHADGVAFQRPQHRDPLALGQVHVAALVALDIRLSGHGHRAVLHIDATAVALRDVADDIAAADGQLAPVQVHARAVALGLVAGDVAPLQGEAAAIHQHRAAQGRAGIATGDDAGLGRAAVGHGQVAVPAHIQHIAAVVGAVQVPVDGVSVQIQGHRTVQDLEGVVLRPGGDVPGQLHGAALVERLLERRPGGDLRHPQHHLAVLPGDLPICIGAFEAGRAVAGGRGDGHRAALGGLLLGGHADAGIRVQPVGGQLPKIGLVQVADGHFSDQITRVGTGVYVAAQAPGGVADAIDAVQFERAPDAAAVAPGLVAGDGAAGLLEGVAYDKHAAAVAPSDVAGDAAAGLLEVATGNHTTAVVGGPVAGDAAARQRQAATGDVDAAGIALAAVVAAGDPAGLVRAAVRDGQLAAHQHHAAALHRRAQVSVDGIAVQVQGDFTDVHQRPVTFGGDDVVVQHHLAALEKRGLELGPGEDALLPQNHAAVVPEGQEALLADKALRIIRACGGDGQLRAVLGQGLYGHADIGRAVQRAIDVDLLAVQKVQALDIHRASGDIEGSALVFTGHAAALCRRVAGDLAAGQGDGAAPIGIDTAAAAARGIVDYGAAGHVDLAGDGAVNTAAVALGPVAADGAALNGERAIIDHIDAAAVAGGIAAGDHTGLGGA